MSPWTQHIETVVWLEKVERDKVIYVMEDYINMVIGLYLINKMVKI